MRYWLMKSEPDVYSIDDLAADGETTWDGVRNYQARNFMTNDMSVGDRVLFYHSNARPSGVAGEAVVKRAAAPDPTQFDRRSAYFEKRAVRDKPIWFGVTLGFVAKSNTVISLDDLRAEPKLAGMAVLRRGQRLSVQPVTAEEFKCVQHLMRR